MTVIDVCDIQKIHSSIETPYLVYIPRIVGVDRRSVSVFELISPRACHFSDDVRALPYCREFVCTLLDLVKDQISDGESAAANIVIVIATQALEVCSRLYCGDVPSFFELVQIRQATVF